MLIINYKKKRGLWWVCLYGIWNLFWYFWWFAFFKLVGQFFLEWGKTRDSKNTLESSNTLTHKDYTANCSSSKLIVSKRSFSRNFLIIIRHLLYFFLIRFSQQVLLEESWRLLCRRFHSIGPWLCPIRDRFGFCCSSKPKKS